MTANIFLAQGLYLRSTTPYPYCIPLKQRPGTMSSPSHVGDEMNAIIDLSLRPHSMYRRVSAACLGSSDIFPLAQQTVQMGLILKCKAIRLKTRALRSCTR